MQKFIIFRKNSTLVMKRWIALFLVCFSLSSISFAQQKKVVVILVDGIPYDVIKKVNTPHLKEIASKGALGKA